MMHSKPRLRRFTGLTSTFVGLLGIFSTLTLAAQDKGTWAVLTAVTGLALAIGGLRLLARESG